MISRFTRDSWRCRLSIGISSRASIGPLCLVFTSATPQRGSPAGVLRRHGAAGPPGLPHGRGVRRAGPVQPQPAALAGNSPHSSHWLETPPCRSSGGGWKTQFIPTWQKAVLQVFQPGVHRDDAQLSSRSERALRMVLRSELQLRIVVRCRCRPHVGHAAAGQDNLLGPGLLIYLPQRLA